MESIIEKKFSISCELLRIQEFWTFTNNVHEIADCKGKDCDIDKFFKKIKDVLFNEELTYE